MITATDRLELRLFEMYLKRRAEHPEELQHLSYAAIYGEVVFEDEEAGPDDREVSGQ